MAARKKKKTTKQTALKKKPSKKAASSTKKAKALSKKASPTARPQPLIAVRDVCASARWYAKLLGLDALGDRHPDHRDVYDRIIDPKDKDRLVLQLHAWDEEDHPNLVDREKAKVGHGVLLWFELDDFDAGVTRARELHADVIEEPHV